MEKQEFTFVDNTEFTKDYKTIKTYNTTSNRLSKFERTAIIGIRATQLSNGSMPMIDVTGVSDVIEIAEAELRQKKTPFIIVRDLNIRKEYWKIEDMIIG